MAISAVSRSRIDQSDTPDSRLPPRSRHSATTAAARTHGPVEGMLERYRIYLTVERGLGKETARGYVDSMRTSSKGGFRPMVLH